MRVSACFWVPPEDSELDAYKEGLDSAKSIPEQCFGDSYLRLAHARSGLRLDFTALDALRAWRAEDRPPVQVGAAQDWMKSRQRDVEASGAITLEYDWCALPGDHARQLGGCLGACQVLACCGRLRRHAFLHRTFTTSYKGTLRPDSHAGASVSGQPAHPAVACRSQGTLR